MEVEILQVIHTQVHPKAKIKINIKVEAPTNADTTIKENPFRGLIALSLFLLEKGG